MPKKTKIAKKVYPSAIEVLDTIREERPSLFATYDFEIIGFNDPQKKEDCPDYIRIAEKTDDSKAGRFMLSLPRADYDPHAYESEEFYSLFSGTEEDDGRVDPVAVGTLEYCLGVASGILQTEAADELEFGTKARARADAEKKENPFTFNDVYPDSLLEQDAEDIVDACNDPKGAGESGLLGGPATFDDVRCLLENGRRVSDDKVSDYYVDLLIRYLELRKGCTVVRDAIERAIELYLPESEALAAYLAKQEGDSEQNALAVHLLEAAKDCAMLLPDNEIEEVTKLLRDRLTTVEQSEEDDSDPPTVEGCVGTFISGSGGYASLSACIDYVAEQHNAAVITLRKIPGADYASAKPDVLELACAATLDCITRFIAAKTHALAIVESGTYGVTEI